LFINYKLKGFPYQDRNWEQTHHWNIKLDFFRLKKQCKFIDYDTVKKFCHDFSDNMKKYIESKAEAVSMVLDKMDQAHN
jgi:hypothetical protein